MAKTKKKPAKKRKTPPRRTWASGLPKGNREYSEAAKSFREFILALRSKTKDCD